MRPSDAVHRLQSGVVPSDVAGYLPDPTNPLGLAMYATVGIFVLAKAKPAIDAVTGAVSDRSDATPEPSPDDVDPDDESSLEGDEEESVDMSGLFADAHLEGDHVSFDDLGERHRTATAPESIEWQTRAARVGEDWTTTMVIRDYPDYPQDGFLSDLFEMTDVDFDLTVNVTPRNQETARNQLKEITDDLKVDAELEESSRSSYLQQRAMEAEATYNAVENGTRVFDMAMFVTVRAGTYEDLKVAAQKVRRTLRDEPADLTPKTAICRQKDALKSAAPIGRNEYGGEFIALGDAVGALLASPHNVTILEEGGVEFGLHGDTGTPVVVDPFARDNGYSMFTVGDVGSGKSFGAKQNFIRTLEKSEDRIGIVLEPLGNWAGVAEALGARRITVGGDLGLNPMELKPTPEHVQRGMGEDANPFKEKKDDVMSFLTNYFAIRGVDLGDKRTTLEVAVQAAYERKGITDDISTHDNDSPTIRTLMDVLTDMIDSPDEHVLRSKEEAPKLRNDAKWILDQLRPFGEGGQYENLAKPTGFDIRDEKVIYLDLGQREGSVGSGTSLLMQLLISLVYERAKETEKEVVFAIDEARYIMQDAANLEFLETVFRHHRHHDLAIRLITQTVDEFFQHHESEAILDQCVVKQFHRLDGMDEQWAEEFGLNYAQMQYVQDAQPGSEELGYSEALLGINGEWRGIEVHAMEKEQAVIDFDARKQSRDELPGIGGESATADIERTLARSAAADGSEEPAPGSADESGAFEFPQPDGGESTEGGEDR